VKTDRGESRVVGADAPGTAVRSPPVWRTDHGQPLGGRDHAGQRRVDQVEGEHEDRRALLATQVGVASTLVQGRYDLWSLIADTPLRRLLDAQLAERIESPHAMDLEGHEEVVSAMLALLARDGLTMWLWY
jgi:hypothetical protein